MYKAGLGKLLPEPIKTEATGGGLPLHPSLAHSGGGLVYADAYSWANKLFSQRGLQDVRCQKIYNLIRIFGGCG